MRALSINGSRRLAWPMLLAAAFVTAALAAVFASRSTADEHNTVSLPVSVAAAPLGYSFADVVEQVSPAVVNIAVTKSARPTPTAALPGRVPRGDSRLDEFFGRFFEMPGQSGTPRGPQRSQGQGSGFVVDTDGYIATNQHVIEGADEIIVTLQSGEKLEATLLGQDARTDLALIKIDAPRGLSALRFGDSDHARVGDWVLAIGNPFGLGGTATAGIISARGRDIQSGPYDDYLQIDAPINSGNSGGPVFNSAGEVIGVNTAIFSPNGGNIGIGFAIPANQAKLVVAALRSNGSVNRGWLGVQIQDLSDDVARALGMMDASGALIAEIVHGGPAESGGLATGDVITHMDGDLVESAKDLGLKVGAGTAGQSVTVAVWRDGRSLAIDIELGDLTRSEQIVSSVPLDRSAPLDLGLGLKDLTAAEKNRYGIQADEAGALVIQVAPDSAAARQGMRPGDVIVQVNQSPVASAQSLSRELANAKQQHGTALLLVRRGGSQRFLALNFA